MASVGAKPAPLAPPAWSRTLVALLDLVIFRTRIDSALHEGVDIEEARPGEIMIAGLDHAGREIEIATLARRRRQREMSRGRMLAAVPTANVIVTNPTHYAVALQYDETSMRAPRIVAMGADLLALKIREVASANRIPMLEAPPLARALYRHGDIDGEVPVELYTAVAQVLAWVFRLQTAVRAPALPVIQVPHGMDPLDKATT